MNDAYVAPMELQQLHQDALTMALRLLGEDEDTFAPETHEVMSRWRVKCDTYMKEQTL